VQFDADIEGDQVAGRDHHAHAQRREDHQHRELELADRRERRTTIAQRDGDGAEAIDGHLGEGGGLVGDVGRR
jgi:hypothetical protein